MEKPKGTKGAPERWNFVSKFALKVLNDSLNNLEAQFPEKNMQIYTEELEPKYRQNIKNVQVPPPSDYGLKLKLTLQLRIASDNYIDELEGSFDCGKETVKESLNSEYIPELVSEAVESKKILKFINEGQEAQFIALVKEEINDKYKKLSGNPGYTCDQINGILMGFMKNRISKIVKCCEEQLKPDLKIIT